MMAANLLIRIERLDRALASVEVACKESSHALYLMEADAMRRHLAVLKGRVETAASLGRAEKAIAKLKAAVKKRAR